MDSKTLEMIVALAEERSIVSAAERLNVSVGDVEKFCYEFKWETKTDFLEFGFVNRFVSGQGMEVYKKAKKMLNELDSFGKWMNDLRPEPAGDITIVTMPFTGVEWLMPKLKPFLEKYPLVKINLVLKNPPIQPGEGDVVITIPSVIGPKGFKSQKLIAPTYSLYASPEYLEKYGTPTRSKDLDHHRLIALQNYTPFQGYYSQVLTVGRKTGQPPREPYFKVDSITALFGAVKLGLGIAELPNIGLDNVGLIKILPSVQSDQSPLHYICERNRERTPLIGELYNHLSSCCLEESTKKG